MNTILNFLIELQENNNRPWMEENKKLYQQTRKEFEKFVADLIAEVGLFDESLLELSPKDCIFRLNRDIRFSPDKTPYKTNYAAALQAGGKKSSWGGYYLHIKPGGESFVGGGNYMPASNVLAKIRQEIDYNGEELREILADSDFKAYFGEMRGNQVKTSPKGYAKDNPQIDLLRFKGYVVTHSFSDETLSQDNFLAQVVNGFKKMKPFIDFLNRSLE